MGKVGHGRIGVGEGERLEGDNGSKTRSMRSLSLLQVADHYELSLQARVVRQKFSYSTKKESGTPGQAGE
jgi:hypothetical protein